MNCYSVSVREMVSIRYQTIISFYLTEIPDLISSKPFRISTFGKYKPFKNYTGLLSDRLESDIRISSKELTPSTLLMSLRRFLG